MFIRPMVCVVTPSLQQYGAGPPPYSEPPPPTNPNLPYVSNHIPPCDGYCVINTPFSSQPTGPQSGVQPPQLPGTHVPPAHPVEPPNLDLPPVPNTTFPDTSTSDSGGGDVDFDDLTRRFEQLKKRK